MTTQKPLRYDFNTWDGSVENTSHVIPLKCDPDLFKASAAGKRAYEIRLNDRGFNPGDILILLETAYSGYEMAQGQPLIYTSRHLFKRVVSVLNGFGLQPSWVVMAVEDLKPEELTKQLVEYGQCAHLAK